MRRRCFHSLLRDGPSEKGLGLIGECGGRRRFEESLKLSTLVPIDIYRFPSPPFSTTLRLPSTSTTTSSSRNSTTAAPPTIIPFATRLHDYWRARLAHSTSASDTGPPAPEPNTATAVILGARRGGAPGVGAYGSAAEDDKAYLAAAGAALPDPAPARARGGAGPFAGKRVYLASDLGLGAGLERALRARVSEAGGACWGFAAAAAGESGDELEEDDEDEDEWEGEGEGRRARRGSRGSTAERADAWAQRRKAEKRLRASDIVVMRTREGWEYWTVRRAFLPLSRRRACLPRVPC